MNERELLFALLRIEVCAERLELNIGEELTLDLMGNLLVLASSHDLAHITGQALKKLGYLGDNPVSQMIDDNKNR